MASLADGGWAVWHAPQRRKLHAYSCSGSAREVIDIYRPARLDPNVPIERPSSNRQARREGLRAAHRSSNGRRHMRAHAVIRSSTEIAVLADQCGPAKILPRARDLHRCDLYSVSQGALAAASQRRDFRTFCALPDGNSDAQPARSAAVRRVGPPRG